MRNRLLVFATALITQCALGQSFEDFEVPHDTALHVGARVITIRYVRPDRMAHETGSGFLIDEDHALTAAHVVADLPKNFPIVVQVGVLPREWEVEGLKRQRYLTTATVDAIDYARDLARLKLHSVVGPFKKVSVCSERPSTDTKFLLASTGEKSNGSSDPMLVGQWLPQWRHPLTDIDQFPGNAPGISAPTGMQLRVGDPVVTLGFSANEGDSGAALISERGCIFGIVSNKTNILTPDQITLGVTIATPIGPNEPLLQY